MVSLHSDAERCSRYDVHGMVLVVGDARGADEERAAQRRCLRQEHGHAAAHPRPLEAGLQVGNFTNMVYYLDLM